jgi:hypothetical protein
LLLYVGLCSSFFRLIFVPSDHSETVERSRKNEEDRRKKRRRRKQGGSDEEKEEIIQRRRRRIGGINLGSRGRK